MAIGTATRREFFKRASAFSLLGAGGTLGLQLASIASVADAAPTEDYKALVCFNMLGGNDHLDTVYPYDPDNFTSLQRARSAIMRERSTLLPITTKTSQGGKLAAFHPNLIQLRSLYNSGRVAVISNIGPMQSVLSKANIIAGSPLPPGVGSHNDGNAMWHALNPDGAIYGWGGLMADALIGLNPNAAYSSVSAGIYNPFGSGKLVQQYSVSPDSTALPLEGLGPPNNFYGPRRSTYFESPNFGRDLERWITPTSANLMEQHYVSQVRRVIAGSEVLTQAFSAQKNFPLFNTGQADWVAYRNNRVGYELRAVAQLIAQRNQLGVKRQVFFVDHFAYDNHGGMIVDHGNRMKELDAAIGYFQNVIDAMGLANNVTLFTTSEFGRAIIPGGDGTGHGWGGLQFVIGGAVKGGDIFGQLPTTDPNGSDFLPSGAMVPKHSVEQMVATLGRWFGVSETDLKMILPNWNRFSPAYLDFMI